MAMEKKHGCAGCLTIFAVAVVIGLVADRSSDKHNDTGNTGSTEGKPTAPAVSPHEQRLADLRQKREGIYTSIAIEREMGKKLANDAMKLSMEPLPDPDERQFLMNKMDEEEKRIAELVEEAKRIDAEIAREEQQSGHNQGSVAAPSREAPAEVTAPRQLSADEIQRLTKQRQYDSDLIAAVDGILNAASPSERAESYCRFTVDQTEALVGASDSETHRMNIDRCKAAVLAGSQSIPVADELRQKAEQARQEMAEIDAKLKPGQ